MSDLYAEAEAYIRATGRGTKLVEALLARCRELEENAPKCAYCTWEGTSTTTVEEMQAHIGSCEHHPIAKLKKENDRLRRALHTVGIRIQTDKVISDTWWYGPCCTMWDYIFGVLGLVCVCGATSSRNCQIHGNMQDYVAKNGFPE